MIVLISEFFIVEMNHQFPSIVRPIKQFSIIEPNLCNNAFLMLYMVFFFKITEIQRSIPFLFMQNYDYL